MCPKITSSTNHMMGMSSAILWTLRRLVLIFDVWCSVSTTYFSVCTKWQKVFVEKVADTFFYPILLWGWEFSWVCVHGYGSWSFEKWFLSVKRYSSFIMHDISTTTVHAFGGY